MNDQADIDKELRLYDATLAELLRRVQSGDCSAADLANAVKFLRDQGLTASNRNKKLATLENAVARVLPFPTPTKPRS